MVETYCDFNAPLNSRAHRVGSDVPGLHVLSVLLAHELSNFWCHLVRVRTRGQPRVRIAGYDLLELQPMTDRSVKRATQSRSSPMMHASEGGE